MVRILRQSEIRRILAKSFISLKILEKMQEFSKLFLSNSEALNFNGGAV